MRQQTANKKDNNSLSCTLLIMACPASDSNVVVTDAIIIIMAITAIMAHY